MTENNQGLGPVRRFIQRYIPHEPATVGGILALNKEQRLAHPNVIFTLESSSPFDFALVQASSLAMTQGAQTFPLKVDVEEASGRGRVVIRTASNDRHQLASEAALFYGLTEATRREISDDQVPESQDLAGYLQRANEVSIQLLLEMTSKPGVMEAFQEYYGGLRWGSDQDKFIDSIFEYSADFDPDYLRKNLSGSEVSSLQYILGNEIPYEEQRDWYERSAEEIFSKFPQLDYKRLEDEEFRQTEEGSKMLAAYKQLCGQMRAMDYRRGVEIKISDEGTEIPRLLIPISKYPIVEALIINEFSFDKPREKYNFGPSEITDIVLKSDSADAIMALATSVASRLPEDQRPGFAFDGPSEFEHKGGNVDSILYSYFYSPEGERRDLIKPAVIKIFDSYTGQGEIAESIREENKEYRTRSRRWNKGKEEDSPDCYKVKDIIRDLITVSINAPDPEVTARAQGLIEQSLLPEDALATPDSLRLSRGELMIAVLDSLRFVSEETNPEIIKSVAATVFGSQEVGARLSDFVQTSMQARELLRRPEVMLTWKAVMGFGHSTKKSDEEAAARKRWADAKKPGESLQESLKKDKNIFLLETLYKLAQSGVLAERGEAATLFKQIVKRVEFSGYEMKVLPEEYHALIGLAKQPGINERQQSDILWHIEDKFKHVYERSVSLLVPVILDMLEVALGPADAVNLPTSETDRMLDAVTNLIRENGKGIFKSASQEELQTIGQYAKGVVERANQIGLGAILTDGEKEVDLAELTDWQKEALENIKRVLDNFKSIEGYYRDHLELVAVRQFPGAYYPWLLEKFVPFWRKMQWEVGPGNRPSQDIRELYQVLEHHVKNELVLRENGQYSDDFDAVGEGHVDTLLLECYNRMIVPHDIKYNNTVWNEGNVFMHQAVAYMPESVLQQIKTKYPDSAFSMFLEVERARWNKEEDVT